MLLLLVVVVIGTPVACIRGRLSCYYYDIASSSQLVTMFRYLILLQATTAMYVRAWSKKRSDICCNYKASFLSEWPFCLQGSISHVRTYSYMLRLVLTIEYKMAFFDWSVLNPEVPELLLPSFFVSSIYVLRCVRTTSSSISTAVPAVKSKSGGEWGEARRDRRRTNTAPEMGLRSVVQSRRSTVPCVYG